MKPFSHSRPKYLTFLSEALIGASLIATSASTAFAADPAAGTPPAAVNAAAPAPAAAAAAAPVAVAPAIVAPPAAKEFSSELSNGIVLHIDKLKRAAGGTVMVQGRIVNSTSTDNDFSIVRDSYSYRIPVRLQDLVGKRQYEMVTVDGYIVGSKHISSSIAPQGALKFWTRVTAPPETVNEVTVVFPGDGPPIDNVPIEK